MKYSQTIGIIAVLALLVSCFFPWIEVISLHKTFSGIDGKVNDNLTFGKQIIGHTFFAIFLIAFFLVQKIWAKRANILFGLMNLGWAIKNYILFSMCRQGDCPKVLPALYLVVLLAFVIQVMVLIPKMAIKNNAN
ncbi:MAG: hypothetical protein JST94_01650 [Bacteroidetes bacterium]|nr:hypothetical protein [Bacteroidota bacterium]MBS1670156.1 hypothetical protein [Bacteroidota bacterium]